MKSILLALLVVSHVPGCFRHPYISATAGASVGAVVGYEWPCSGQPGEAACTGENRAANALVGAMVGLAVAVVGMIIVDVAVDELGRRNASEDDEEAPPPSDPDRDEKIEEFETSLDQAREERNRCREVREREMEEWARNETPECLKASRICSIEASGCDDTCAEFDDSDDQRTCERRCDNEREICELRAPCRVPIPTGC